MVFTFVTMQYRWTPFCSLHMTQAPPSMQVFLSGILFNILSFTEWKKSLESTSSFYNYIITISLSDIFVKCSYSYSYSATTYNLCFKLCTFGAFYLENKKDLSIKYMESKNFEAQYLKSSRNADRTYNSKLWRHLSSTSSTNNTYHSSGPHY